jgi:iron complex outermembrane recepter protein
MTNTNSPSPITLHRKCGWTIRILGVAVLAAGLIWAAEPARKTFDVPAGAAAQTLKQAAQQAGLEIMFPTETVRGVRTSAIKGEYVALDAINRMLVGTDLVATQDGRSGALTVKHVPPSPPPPRPTSPAPPTTPKSATDP